MMMYSNELIASSFSLSLKFRRSDLSRSISAAVRSVFEGIIEYSAELSRRTSSKRADSTNQ